MKLSIITTTFNAIDQLPNLVESLRNQKDKDFEWIIYDSASIDGTVEYLKTIDDLPIRYISEKDFGIYDAINKALILAKGDFYIVIGADDYLYPNAISDYKNSICPEADIITASIRTKKGVVSAFGESYRWLFAQAAYVSSHSVGTIYRKTLHKNNGLYSRYYPIAADQHFTLLAIKNGARLKKIDSIVGYYNDTGISSNKVLGCLSEIYQIQLLMGESKFIQTILFFLRIIKNYKKLT